MQDQLTFDEAIEIVAKSYFLEKVIGKRPHNRLKRTVLDLPSATVETIRDAVPNLEDSIYDIKAEEFLSYRIVSDDFEGSEYGPWHVDIYGACGVWLVNSIDYDDLWFSTRDSAISAANDYAHDSVIEEIDYGIAPFQETNAEVDRRTLLRNKPIAPAKPKSLPENRVLGFYIGENAEHILRHNRYGRDNESSIVDLIAYALGETKRVLEESISKASELGWSEAVKALNLALETNQNVDALKYKLEQSSLERIVEIEVDDWVRENRLVTPTIEDFVKMAAELKPFLRYREASQTWDAHRPKVYLAAYQRVVKTRREIEETRSHQEE